VVVGGKSIGVGQGHSRRIAETDAAAHAIETLRRSSEAAVHGSAEAPELADFRDADEESDAADWDTSGNDQSAADEPWIEFDLDTLIAVPERVVTDGEIADGEVPEGGTSGRDRGL
jgi:hypothetical protein